jgi:hypothetical protein
VGAPWELIVYNYDFFLTINEKTESIATSCVRFFSDKEALDAFWELSQGRYRREEITISTLSLLDI